ncbi:MAG: EAL domain-containing protein, partial [Clostridia bacterium]
MQKKSMLIVDDVVINRLLLQEIFKGDFNIFLAENGLVALNILKEQNIDIIILDVIMPVMNGYEVLAVLQKDKKLAEIPVVVATSMSDVENEVKVLELGATDLITKPFDSKVIKRRVQNIIEKCEVEKVKIENLVLKQEQQAQIRLKAIMENMLNSVVLIECSDDFEILYKNKAYYNLIGVDENNYDENNDVLLQKMLSTKKLDFLKHVRSVLEGEKSYTYEWRLVLENDVVLWLKLNFTKFNYIENKHPVILLMLTDITKEKTAELNLKFRADHDVLTEIYNRETFYRETEIMIKASPKTKFLLITSNIEKFKIINDLFGVRFGDNILKKYAKILQQHILGIGTYGRLDSDHFALCIPKKTLTNKKIDALIGSWIVEMQINYPLIIKYGLYEIIDTNMPINKMCDMANLAIQKIKGNYIQHFAFYNEDMLKLMMEEQEIVNKFNDALKNKEFVVYFQPVYSVSTNMPISAEALIRWKQPDGSLLSPAKFIPIAEKNGFITKIDYFVWDYVCKFLSQRIKANKPITPISVNVSRLNLYNPNLVNDILAITQKYNITHNLIKFEITESAYTSNPEIMQKFIAQMHKLNFEILMDDFGSGYSSLNMLKDLHVDYLKIDMKFLCDLEKSSRAGCILISISRMAKWLKLPIIYEGVETVNEINFLKSIGCERIQGYYFSPPVSVSAFSILINNVIQIPLVANSITPSLIDFDYLFNGNNFVAKFFDSVNFGIAFYEYSDETCELIRSNSAFNTLFTTASTLANNNVLKLMNKEELKQFNNAVITARQTCKPSEFIHKKITAGGIAITLRVAISILGSLDDKYILCVVINDINTTNYKLPTTETKAIKLAISEHKLQSYMPTFLSMFADIIEIDFDTNDLKVLYTHYGDKANLNKSRNFSATLEHWIKTFLHPEDASNFYNYIKKIPLNDTTAPENFQYRIVVNGAVTWMSFSSANIEKNKYLCYSKEITKEKEFTKILQQNASLQHENFEKARYQIIVESSNMIVMEWDIVNDNFYRSKGFEKYAICYEQPNELFNGKANLSVVHSEDVGLLNKFISDSKDPLVKAITKTLRLKTTNNTYEWCRLLGNFICNEQGKRVRIIATITNIDKEIKAQTEIRKANALLNSISDNIFGGIGIFEIIGATTRATYLNAGYYKMLGYKNKEDFGTHAINTIKDMHPEDIDTVLDSIEKSIQTKKPITFTYRAKQKSGNYIWIKALTTYQEMSQEGN